MNLVDLVPDTPVKDNRFHLGTDQPVTLVETITPARAKTLLARNTKNRNLREKLIRKYEAAMRAGQWELNGETIIIADDGTILDGQHRLHACVRSGKAFQTNVAYNVRKEAFPTIDQGMSRTCGDVLGIAGTKYANIIASAVRWVEAIKRDHTDSSVVFGGSETLRRYERDTDGLEYSAKLGSACSRVAAPGICTALHHVFSKRDLTAADAFFTDLARGADLRVKDPVYVLREKLLKAKTSKLKYDKAEVAALIIRAWNHRRAGKDSKQLKGILKKSEGKLYPAIAD